ncbi:protease modulator HflK [bacterium]
MDKQSETAISTTPSIEKAAGHLKATGLAVPVGNGLTAVLCLYLGSVYQLAVLRALGQYLLLLTGLLFMIRLLLGMKAELAEAMAEKTASAPEDKESEDSDEESNQPDKVQTVIDKIEDFAAGLRNYFNAVFALIVGIYCVSTYSTTGAPAVAEKTALGLGLLCLVFAFVSLTVSRYYAEQPKAEFPEVQGLGYWYKLGVWIFMIAAVSLFMRGLKFPMWEAAICKIITIFIILLVAEMLARAVGAMFSPKQTYDKITIKIDFLFLRILVSKANPVSSFFESLEEYFGINLKSTWALDFAKRSLLPIAVLLALVGWLCTSLVMISLTEQGIHERFGKPVSREPLEPGLHLIYPRPIDRIVRVPVHRTNVMGIGYEEAVVGASMLWTKAHAAEEYSLLIGDGRDLVSVNAELIWRVGDIYEYLYGSQNPEETLKVLAYRVLLKETVDKNLDGVLSENVETFCDRVRDAIQKEAEGHHLGIEVTAFYLKGLHPPIDVAPDYQAVISAQVDKVTRIINANVYREQTLPMTRAEALWAVNGALAQKNTRLMEAKGEAIKFTTLEKQYSVSPELFRMRRRMETLEKTLKMKPLYIIDDRIEGVGGSLWIDMRSGARSEF